MGRGSERIAVGERLGGKDKGGAGATEKPGHEGRVSVDQLRGRGANAAADQYFATTGADGAKLNR